MLFEEVELYARLDPVRCSPFTLIRNSHDVLQKTKGPASFRERAWFVSLLFAYAVSRSAPIPVLNEKKRNETVDHVAAHDALS